MSQINLSRLPAIRVALLTGALAFGAASWFVQRRPGWAPNPQVDRSAFVRLIRIELAIVLVAILVLFLLVRRAREAQRTARLSTVAWAIGEGAALLGGTYYYSFGDATWYGIGLSLLVLTLVAFPARLAVRR